ncbi:N-acetylglucosaminyl-diphospho-decaprenol L-rhamnosyltransferase [Gammaproteobacteria bacterium MOLA455]|nr:N-acetylglucosaminyl-diphospho-decaprenol L-rhamnosyltransferase [Gammaproteobacteria bacterium MOLA455]
MKIPDSSSLTTLIVNYKTPDLCIGSLKSLHTNETCPRIIIIDNASGDDSINRINSAIMQNNWHKTSVFVSASNKGFSAGNNIGINASTSDYVLLLNSDTLVRAGAVELLVKTLDDSPTVGIASPRLEWPDGSPQESCFRFHRPVNELIRSAATGPITKLLKCYEVPLRVSPEVSHPEWTSFACVLIRRKVFEDIGLLDEEFFMYFEDVDFCKRARDAGWNIAHNPAAHVVHLRGGSSTVKSQAAKKKRLPGYFYESRTRYYYKHFGRFGLFRANIFWHLGWLVAMFRKALDRSYQPNICEKQWLDVWTNFLNPTAPYIHPDNYL